MIIGAEKDEEKLVRVNITFDPETFECAVTNENAKNCCQIQMILDEAVRMFADTRQQLLAQAYLKEQQEQAVRAQLMMNQAHVGRAQ
jgi:predicted TIM-barrel enzyme